MTNNFKPLPASVISQILSVYIKYSSNIFDIHVYGIDISKLISSALFLVVFYVFSPKMSKILNNRLILGCSFCMYASF